MARSLADYFSGDALRLGVTGLSGAGKTVFITALIDNLVDGGRLPVLRAAAEGRIARVRIDPQPDDAVPRFPYEEHAAALAGSDRRWPASTRRVSELRATIEFERASAWGAPGRAARSRHRRLSWRMAARPAADRQILRRVVARNARGGRGSGARAARRPLDALPARPRPRRARRGGGGAARRRSLHRLSADARATTILRALDAVARPVPDARRSRGLAGADLRAAAARRRRGDRPRLAGGDDGAALRSLQDPCRAAVLPRPFRPPRPADRAGRHARARSTPARPRSPTWNRAERACWRPSAPAAPRAWARSFRPRVDRILFAATKADHLHHSRSRPAGGDAESADPARDRARRGSRAPRSTSSRSPPCAPPAKRRSASGGEMLKAIVGVPEAGETHRRRDLRRRRRGGGVSRRAARRSRRGCWPARRWRCRRPRTTGASCASARRSRRARPARTSGSTARCNSSSETDWHERTPPPSPRLPARRPSASPSTTRPRRFAPTAIVALRTIRIPRAAGGAPLDAAEREIEAAQSVGVARRWRPTVAGLVSSGARRPRLARARPVDDRTDRGAVRARRARWAGSARPSPRCWSSASSGCCWRARSLRCCARAASPNCTPRWRAARAADDRDRRAPLVGAARRALRRRPETARGSGRGRGGDARDRRRPRPRRRRRTRAARPLDAQGAGGDRRGGASACRW